VIVPHARKCPMVLWPSAAGAASQQPVAMIATVEPARHALLIFISISSGDRAAA